MTFTATGLPKRASINTAAGDRPSARHWQAASEFDFLVPGPVRRPKEWLKWVNQAITVAELEALRRSVNRGTPFGSERWVVKTASELGLQSTLRPRGRPRKSTSETAE